MVSLTAITPFLGSLILFNEQVIELVRLGSSMLLSGEQAESFSLMRLKLTYVGLVGLGLASFSFLLTCPPEIKLHESVHQFIERELPLMSAARHRILLAQTLEAYFAAAPQSAPTAAYPQSLFPFFHSFIHEVVERMDESTEWIDRDGNSIVTLHGSIDTDTAARLLYEATPPYRGFISEFERKSADLGVDLLTLRYGAADYARPFMRGVITICFALGFLALSIPTVQTFYLVIAPSIRRILGP